VDENHQVKLSLTARGLLGEAPVLLVTPGPDGCLLICTPAGLPQLLEQLGQAMTEGTAHAVRRLYFAQTEKCVLDADGRFTISKNLAKFADLGRNAVLIGVGDYFELWDAGRWQKYLEQNAVGE
jgi:MraZ protein